MAYTSIWKSHVQNLLFTLSWGKVWWVETTFQAMCITEAVSCGKYKTIYYVMYVFSLFRCVLVSLDNDLWLLVQMKT